MEQKLPKLIVTSVVRGSQQGESHGGVFTVDFDNQDGIQHIDWNTGDIDWEGRGADRGLRGIEFDGDDIYIAASDELFVYNRDFEGQRSFKNRYLKHCHEICRMERMIFVTSTGFDSLMAFNLDSRAFEWGFHLQKMDGAWAGHTFDPRSESGPRPINDFHINMVHVDSAGIFLSGLNINALLHINSEMKVSTVCDLPVGTHNSRPWRDGVVLNDTASDCVRFVSRSGTEKAFKIVTYDETQLEQIGIDDSKVARQGFGRGLCTLGERFIVGGSSPSTISLYDVQTNQKVGSVNLSMDIRNAIHGLEIWPY
ncbi:MAG: hypothetical protein HOI35_00885 [Woeseia sp.]|jgi:hypothetical protein|nr:hypothetical protein [Woeseia sp.]MBT6208563.1 hypothetical protein [Woeseia sp.]